MKIDFSLTFDFIHILKSIRNNWLNQKDIDKTIHFPDAEILKLIIAGTPNVRQLYRSESRSLAKLTMKACFPSSIEIQMSNKF